MTNTHHILWADDEIDLLKPHLMFLNSRGYQVTTATDGHDALDLVDTDHFDLIILDENMPGLSGLETLSRLKEKLPNTPVIMITKSEEENIMNQAIGNKIADYLIKPVNPNQILIALKRLLHSDTLVAEQATKDYREDFMQLSSLINTASTIEDWYALYTKLVYRELELAGTQTNLDQMLAQQKEEANKEFAKWVKRNYERWMPAPDASNAPLMSPRIFPDRVFPMLDAGEKVFFILIDNFRLDQWRTISSLLADSFNISEELYTAILPTATQYARNAIFSGLMPAKIEKMFPDLWVDEDSEEGKNLNESPLIATQIERYRKKYKFSYTKINDTSSGDRLARDIKRLYDNNDLNVIVLNFIDMLSHARTESKMIRELASSDAAYRSLTESWFKHSSALDIFRAIAQTGAKIVLTTDHGTIRVDNPIKVVGDKNVNSNLRYKVGKNLGYNQKQVYEIKRPEAFGLPSPNVSSTYIFATGADFFAYPNNYNHYVQYYSDTFQHGGISMEEMLVPLIKLSSK